jgi:hypothetical protein
MKPITVAATIPEQRERVYAFLDALANHESFTDPRSLFDCLPFRVPNPSACSPSG